MKKYLKKKNLKYFLSGLGILFLLITLGFILWANTPYQATSEAFDSLQSNEKYLVNQSQDIVFKPAKEYSSGVIFYPGGRVDPKAYAPLCEYLSEQQHLCVIVPMPLNLAIFGVDKADEIRKEYPDIHYWVLAGHSLGGSMAARYVQQHLEDNDIKGLALLASYSDVDISKAVILVSSFRGTNDGIFVKDTWLNTQKNLPSKYSTFTEIEGGNHSQFGYYGLQAGDGEATIAHEEQFRIFQEAIHDMLPGH
ncbi:MAG: alpha/beta hydrolase [Candidatus Dojkabacteria bacterium]